MKRIDEQLIQEIKNKTNIVDVVNEHVALTKKGRNYFGVCPFHDDHAPSMSVSPDKQIYRCFSCGASGNAFTFLMNYENISFTEAVGKLGDKLGYNLNYAPSQMNTFQKEYEINEKVTKVYHHILKNNDNASSARDYLKQRGVTDDAIEHFELGYTPTKSDGITSFLMKQGHSIEELIDVNLSSKGETRYYDRFIKRLMIPIRDSYGKIVGFGGRIIESSDHAKYLNSAESDFFKKREILYNYFDAKAEVRRLNQIILMEGYMDIIKAYCFDVKNTVASMGTALTHEQVKLIRRLTDTVYISYDGDSAGKKAALSAGKELEKVACDVKIVMLPNNMDPDDFLSKHGKEAYLKELNQAIPLHEFELYMIRQNHNLSSESGKASFLEDIVSLLKKMSPFERELQVNKLSEEFSLSPQFFAQFFDQPTQSHAKKKNTRIPEPKNGFVVAERELLSNMLRFSKACAIFEKHYTKLITPEMSILSTYVLNEYTKDKKLPNFNDWYSIFSDDKTLYEALETVIAGTDLNEEYQEEMVLDYIFMIKRYHLNQQTIEYEKLASNPTTDSQTKKEAIIQLSIIKQMQEKLK